MRNWNAVITASGKTLDEVKNSRGIFQGDVLWRLLFVISMCHSIIYFRSALRSKKLTQSIQNLITFFMWTTSNCFQRIKIIGDYDTKNKKIQPGYRN